MCKCWQRPYYTCIDNKRAVGTSRLLNRGAAGLIRCRKVVKHVSKLGLGESTILLFEYPLELLNEYSSTRRIPEVATDEGTVQNKRGSLFRFVLLVKQRFEMCQNNAGIWNAYLCSRFLPSKVTHMKVQGVNGGRGLNE